MARPISPEWRKEQVPQELDELRQYLNQLPLPWRERLMPLCERVGHYTRLQSRLIRMAQDTVDQLQLDVKYLLFDVEATRRERDELLRELRGTESEGGLEGFEEE
jgi:hypothetical protein